MSPATSCGVVGDERFVGFEFESRSAEEVREGLRSIPLAALTTAGGRARLFVSDVGGGGDLVVVALRPRPALRVMTRRRERHRRPVDRGAV